MIFRCSHHVHQRFPPPKKALPGTMTIHRSSPLVPLDLVDTDARRELHVDPSTPQRRAVAHGHDFPISCGSEIPYIPGAVGQRLPVPSSHTHLPITKTLKRKHLPESLIAAKCEKKCEKKYNKAVAQDTHLIFIGMVSACPLGAKMARSHRRRAPTHICPESPSKIREWPGQRSKCLNRDEVGKID